MRFGLGGRGFSRLGSRFPPVRVIQVRDEVVKFDREFRQGSFLKPFTIVASAPMAHGTVNAVFPVTLVGSVQDQTEAMGARGL